MNPWVTFLKEVSNNIIASLFSPFFKAYQFLINKLQYYWDLEIKYQLLNF